MVGDVNGDGYDDMLFNNTSNLNNYLVFGGSSFTGGASMALPTALGTFSNYVSINSGGAATNTNISPLSGDFNGDGYSDFALTVPVTGSPTYVYYGGPNLQAYTNSALAVAGNGRGFQITGITGVSSQKFESTNAGDINGDGMDDMVFNDGSTRAFVLFGKTNSTSVNVADLAAGSGGFIINGGTLNTNSEVWDVDVVGDFNGDGLADMVLSNHLMTVAGVSQGGAYLVYGRTATTALTLDTLAVSEGFRITGFSATAGAQLGRTVTAAGDLNGDGFADLAITSYGSETVNGVLNAGVVRIVYGSVDKLESMTFQTANGDAMGTTGADTLVGTSGNNQLVAGDGNDTLTGAGGADVLYGGRGNDTIIINADNVAKLALNTGDSQAIGRVDGGSGIDTIQLDGALINLDFTAINQAAIKNVERIDLTGSGDNTVKLSLLDVLGLSSNNLFNAADTSSGVTAGGSTAATLAASVNKTQMMVTGDTGDKATITDLASWTDTHTNVTYGTHTYEVYNHNTAAAQLLIDQQITII